MSSNALQLALTARQYNLVSVTRRSIRPQMLFFSRKEVPVRGGYGAVFASPALQLISPILEFISPARPKMLENA